MFYVSYKCCRVTLSRAFCYRESCGSSTLDDESEIKRFLLFANGLEKYII
jgi:hypothetical protein